MFELDRKRTADGMRLAQKLWDFLMYTVEKRYNTRWQDKQLNEWAGVWDVFLLTHDYQYVCSVFDFYVENWRQKHGYIHLTPESFIGDFPILEQQMQWSSRPIPEEELRPILLPLSKERWDCEWDYLVTAVSKSVDSLRQFLYGLAEAELADSIKQKLRGIFGNVTEYVTHHFITWRKRQIEAVWIATITLDKVFDEVRKCLTRLGYPASVRNRSIAILRKAIKDGQYAGCGD